MTYEINGKLFTHIVLTAEGLIPIKQKLRRLEIIPTIEKLIFMPSFFSKI